MTHGHDEYDENGYKKRCYCEKCKATYDKWHKDRKTEGCATCQRKCYTVCEIVCEKPVKKVHNWGYKQSFEGKWQAYKGKDYRDWSGQSASDWSDGPRRQKAAAPVKRDRKDARDDWRAADRKDYGGCKSCARH